MDLSIVIPVFNTKLSILKRCINSINNLKNVNYEIIMIDDGSSKENSFEYNKLSKTLQRCTYVKKENGGVSSARNIGIKKSKGKYILFVDSDDIIYYEKITSNIFQSDYDVIYFNYLVINENDKNQEHKEIETETSCDINYFDIMKGLIEEDKFYSPCDKFYKRDFLTKNDIEFNTKMINGEDAIFNLEVLLSKPKMYYYNEILYGYYFDNDHYEKRIINNFDNILNDYLYKYNIKVNTIKEYKLNEKILNKMQNDAVVTCFRISMICSINKINKKQEISNYISEFNIEQNKLLFKNKIKYNLLKKQKWFLVKKISNIRKLYLKIKR